MPTDPVVVQPLTSLPDIDLSFLANVNCVEFVLVLFTIIVLITCGTEAILFIVFKIVSFCETCFNNLGDLKKEVKKYDI